MSTKKKPASKSADGKSAADKGPQPLLKLKFEKFPDKPVAVYFDVTKRLFRATFGFSEHEATSVGALEGKIKAAIHKGATPDIRWVPVILVSLESDNYHRAAGNESLDRHINLTIERKYIAITKEGLREVGWSLAENLRLARATRSFDIGSYSDCEKMKVLPKLPWLQKGGDKSDAAILLLYSEQAWETLKALSGQIGAMQAALVSAINGNDFSKVFIPKAAAAPKPAPKPAAKKAAPKSALLPFHDAAKKPIITGNLGKDVLPNADFKLLDLVIDLPPGPVPAEMLAAAGFPAAATAEKHKDGYFMVTLPRQPEDLSTTTGHVKHLFRAEMQKLIRDRINGQRGAKPQEVKKPSPKKKAKAKKHNGDTTAREHLIVKYQGKQLTLGHGPLGNYLVEALRKTYPEIHSAWCLKDNSVQLHIRGEVEPRTITAADFERLINHPSPQFRETLRSQRGVIGTPSPEWRIAALNGAIAKLHELVDAMQPEDPPLVIPGLILLAAGFPESASADMHSPDEIIVRVPKKAPQFLSLAQFEERIRQRIPAETTPEKEQASA